MAKFSLVIAEMVVVLMVVVVAVVIKKRNSRTGNATPKSS